MTYIVVSENEIVKAEMERPSFSAWEIINPCVNKDRLIKPFQEHCLSLPRIAAPGHKWKLWDEVPESEIKWQYQYCKPDNIHRWFNCEKNDHIGWPKHLCRIIAIPEPVKIKNMTITEKKQPSFGVNDEVYILDTQIYDTPKWIHGVVEEVGDESILVKWDDLTDPTEYQISDMPDIRHREPTPEGEKVEERSNVVDYLTKRIAELKKIDASFCDVRWDMSKHKMERDLARDMSNETTARRHELEDLLNLLNNDNPQTK